MKHYEICMLNQVMQMDPRCITKPNLCRYKEVASPNIILDASLSSSDSWATFPREQAQEEWLYAPSDKSYIIAPRSSTTLWDSIHEIDGKDESAMLTWLLANWERRFIVTYPVFHDKDGAYTYSFFVSKYIKRLSQESSFSLLLESRSFTICNGIILAIAMHRRGTWSGPVLQRAFQQFATIRKSRRLPFWTWFNVDDDWNDIETWPHLPIMHYPDHYALCGGSADCLIQYLCDISNRYSGTFVFSFNGKSKYQSFLSTAACAPETLSLRIFKLLCKEWPQRSTLHTQGDLNEPNWMGFANIITSRPKCWSFWRKNADIQKKVFERLKHACNNESCLYNLVFPALIELYDNTNSAHARISQLWRDCISFYDPDKECVRQWLRAYSLRIRVTDSIASSFPTEVIRHKVPPIGLFRYICQGLSCEEFGKFIHKDNEYRFMVKPIKGHVRFIESATMNLQPIDDDAYQVNASFHQTLEALSTTHPSARIFFKHYVEKPVVNRLLCIRYAFREKKGLHTVENLLLEHLRHNREQLYSIA